MSIRRFYSQAGQDRWVAEQVFNYKPRGFFLEIGAFDGMFLSNTFWLEKNLGWSGVCIEADPGTFGILRRNRKCACLNACVGASGGEVQFTVGQGPYSAKLSKSCAKDNSSTELMTFRCVSLGDILRKTKAPFTIDYLSLDVEGMEDEVMATFPFDKYHFRCATIERPSECLRSTMRKHGYLLVADQPGMDAFYLHPEMVASYVQRAMQRSEVASLSLPRRAARSLSLLPKLGLRAWLRRL